MKRGFMEYGTYCDECKEFTTAKWKILPAYQESVWYSRKVLIILPKMRACHKCGFVVHTSTVVARVEQMLDVDYISNLNESLKVVK